MLLDASVIRHYEGANKIVATREKEEGMNKAITKTKTINGKSHKLYLAYTERNKAQAFDAAKWLRRRHHLSVRVVRVYSGWAVYYRHDVNKEE